MYVLGKESVKQLETVNIELQMLMRAAIGDSPHDFTITEGFRSAKRQRELYEQGRSKGGKIVTQCDGVLKISKHQWARAVDIAIWENGKINYNVKKLLEVRKHVENVAKKMGLKLGKVIQWDLPHYEM